jgi:hypothetical protein
MMKYYLVTETPETVRQPEFLCRDALAGLIFVEKNRARNPTLELELAGNFAMRLDVRDGLKEM